MTVSLAPDPSRIGWIYSQGTVGQEDDDEDYVEVGDGGNDYHYRAFFSFALANIPSNARAFTGGRLTIVLFGGGGDFYKLGPLVVEHVRIPSISVSALSAAAFPTLGAK